MSTPIIDIKNLHVKTDDIEIIKGLDLTINPGEVHVIMGPNGSGKSTLANVLIRNPEYAVTAGSIKLNGEDLTELEADECANKGVFLSFQYPVAIPGVSNMQFLKTAYNAKRKFNNEPPVDAADFLSLIKQKAKTVGIDEKFLKRAVNDGFSGGEKKLNEILQLAVLEPSFAIFDEVDSGLDIDALKKVAAGINAHRAPNRGMLLITHYQRLLDHIEPDYVHVMQNGKIVKSGDKALPHELEARGYEWL